MAKYILFFLLLLASGSMFGQEICNNRIDDDHDGLVDQFDKLDCPCVTELENAASMIPNPSFEILDSLPDEAGELACAQAWEPATNGSSDLYTAASYMFPHFPQPTDGNSFAGTLMFVDYQEYLGTCLPAQMRTGETYTLTFDVAATGLNGVPNCDPAAVTPFDITLYGNSDCVPFPLNTSSCPAISGFSALGSVTYTPNQDWTKLQISFSALQDIQSVILGPSCNLPTGNVCYEYFLWDNLDLQPGKEDALYYVPNVFTPDGNELNQYFEPVFTCGFDIFDYELKIYNRWGNNIFTSNDARIGWDGTLLGEMMQDGLYSWVIRFKAPYTDETTIVSGHVALLR